MHEFIDQYCDVETCPLHLDAGVESLLKRSQEETKRRDYDMHYATGISDDSNEIKKKIIIQFNAIISDESNEAGLSAQNLFVLQQCVDRDHFFELGAMCYK